MTDLHSPSCARKQRLLNGASLSVMVLCASLALAGSAHAQVTTDLTLDAADPGNLTTLNGSFSHDGTATTHTITIDLNNVSTTLDAITNDNSNANGLVFDIIDANADVTANILTMTGNAAASNDGSITFNVGNGTTRNVSFAVQGNITEADSGVAAIVLGNTGGDQTVNLSFASGTATQTIDAAISVVDDADVVGVSIGDSAVSSTTTFNDTITLGTGDTITIGSTGGTSTTDAIFMTAVIAPGGITLEGTTTTSATFADDVTANITLDATGAAQTLTLGASGATTTATGSLDITNTTNVGTIAIADGANVTLVGNINSAVAWDAINVGGGTTATTFTVAGDIADQSEITLSDLGTLVIDATAAARTVLSTINADAAGSTVSLQTVGGGNGVTFNVDVGAVAAIDTVTLGDDTIFVGALNGGNLSAAADVDVTLQANSAVTGDITGEGNLIIGNAGVDNLTLGGGTGTTSTISIANIGGEGDIIIASGSSVTINSTVVGTLATSDFTMNSADTTLTVNSTDTTAITAGGTLTLDQGTIVLGSNIGTGDTVFDVNDLVHNSNADTDVQMSVAFTSGTIVFVNSTLDESLEETDFELAENALATYAIDAVGTQLVITATARTAAETAAELSVSTDAAGAVLQAVTSATTVGDTTGLNALSAELNAGGTRATQAASQVGVQADAVGAGPGVAFQVSGQQQDLASNRLGGLRGAS